MERFEDVAWMQDGTRAMIFDSDLAVEILWDKNSSPVFDHKNNYEIGIISEASLPDAFCLNIVDIFFRTDNACNPHFRE